MAGGDKENITTSSYDLQDLNIFVYDTVLAQDFEPPIEVLIYERIELPIFYVSVVLFFLLIVKGFILKINSPPTRRLAWPLD